MTTYSSLNARIAKRTQELTRSLAQLKENPRVRDIRVIVPPEACPVCQEVAGTYTKETAPALPPEGCSCARGSEAFYQPMLNEIYP
ncbi:MAG: hypothetical protein HYZ49_01945 [Chloroflexi bacterium]|nr:hypothetical protein [Chloroflexota bacterium]